MERTSAALAAADPGLCPSPGAVLPNVLPAPVTFGGAAARALLVAAGALAGEAPVVRPSPWKFALELVFPKQLPIVLYCIEW